MKILIKKLTGEEIQKQGIREWPIWTKEVSSFDWFYDTQEMCLFLEGKVKVNTDFEEVEIGMGDFVTFPQGLKCVWNVIEPVRKHYHFD
ncbi:MAG: cupin [Ignavibacteria bacterium GWB2_35_12]|nr:MAG: cupin [Ignavibacteria bacterium GWA2_35_8]OGU41443.1 MAG: cupin [Ignavibacteria bacterium GWB2_35_12]OGU94993.1 MAG: cupin [Ignavibacteria bacterium RIFOXYA2_FULL_35_10]OGV19380.1 MAG: cupin [Ignavibacteria bacterium RIFOXYC2_FULL_35_21]